jgi:hypothetical protein
MKPCLFHFEIKLYESKKKKRERDPILQIINTIKGWRSGSSGRVPEYHIQSPEFTLSTSKKNKTKELINSLQIP